MKTSKFAIVIVIYILILLVIIIFQPWEYIQEISVHRYKWLNFDCKCQPQIIPIVQNYYKDGKITQHEMNKIQNIIRHLNHIEDNRIRDSIKTELTNRVKNAK